MSHSRPKPPGVRFHSEHAERVFKGIRFDVYHWKQKQFDGSVSTFETVRRTDNVFVLPVIGEEVVLVKEQQPHWDKPGLNSVTGMLEEDEGVLEGAKRELEEETGLIFKNFYLVHIEQPNSSAEWLSYTVIATGFEGKSKDKKLDRGERNKVVRLTIDEYLNTVKKLGFAYRQRCAEDYIIQGKEAEFNALLRDPARSAVTID